MRPGAIKGNFGQVANDYSMETIMDNSVPEPNSGCWLWVGGLNMWGYGKVCIQHKHWIAHRAAFFISTGKDIPYGMQVLHRCDVRSCVNPGHLFLGTHKDNMRDMVNKGRSATGDRNTSRKNPHLQVRGSMSHHAKLTEDDVIKIKTRLAAGEPQKSIAKDFNVGSNNISMINVGEIWKHVVVDHGGGLY